MYALLGGGTSTGYGCYQLLLWTPTIVQLYSSIQCIWMSHESGVAELLQDPCTHTCLSCRSFDAHLPDPACTESSDGAEKKTESAGARAEAAPPTPRNTLLAPPERSEDGHFGSRWRPSSCACQVSRGTSDSLQESMQPPSCVCATYLPPYSIALPEAKRQRQG